MKIRITQEHIDMSIPRTRSQAFSPLSLALCEATGVLWNVAYDHYYPCGFSDKIKVKLPSDARKWVEDYDYNRSVYPAEFEMEIPDVSWITARISWEGVQSTLLE